MEKQKKYAVGKAVLILFDVLLLTAAFAACVYDVATAEPAVRVAAAVRLAALVVGALYLLYGYQKDAARWFRTFMAVSAAALLAMLVSNCIARGHAPGVAFAVLMGVGIVLYGNFLLLGFARDLGPRVALTLAGIGVALSLAGTVFFLIRQGISVNTCLIFSDFALALLAAVMTAAKFIDKAERKG